MFLFVFAITQNACSGPISMMVSPNHSLNNTLIENAENKEQKFSTSDSLCLIASQMNLKIENTCWQYAWLTCPRVDGTNGYPNAKWAMQSGISTVKLYCPKSI